MTQVVTASKSDGNRVESSSLWALVVIAHRLGLDINYAELQRNYALPPGEPATRMLIAIARDQGLDARVIKVKFRDLPRLGRSLPAMLKVKNDGALILEAVGVDPTAGPVALLADPTAPEHSVTAVDELRLMSFWQGEIILFKRRHSVSDETRPFGTGWLFAQVMREKKLFFDVGMAAIISTLFALTPPFAFMIVVNRVLVNQSMSTLAVLSGALGLIIIFETILTFLRRYLTEVATTRIDGRLNLYLMEKLLKLPMDYFEQNPTGRITSKISRMWHIRTFVTGALLGTILDAVPLIGLIPALFILDWRLASMVMVLASIVFIIIMFFIKPIARRYRRVVLAEQSRYSHLIETIHGMRTIKALALEGRRRREWDSRVAESTDAAFTLAKFANYPPTLTLPFERLIYSGSVCLGAYMALTMPESLNAGALGAFAMLAARLGSPLIQLAKLQLDLAEVRGSIVELATVLNTPPEDSRENSGLRQPIEGSVSFKDVRFRYAKDAPYALDGISFSVPKGTSIGVMGRSGSGKTTITRMLQRLNSNYEGLIKIDGMDLREINLAHLRTHIGIVLQENFLFSGSIRENIAMAKPDATLAEVVRAAQLAGAEEFIERMPRGYETILEEGATNLSGGQRQRLAIARTLLTNPPILLLDEATSALDAESEAIINANLRRMAEGRTVISISHRLSMLVDFDVILVMERGRLYDMGTHHELLTRCDIYQQMWYQQNRHLDPQSQSGPVAAIGQG